MTAGVLPHATRAPARRRRPRHLGGYLLILPSVIVIGAVLGYPLVKLGILSFQKYGIHEIYTGTTTWVGFDNYRHLLGNSEFWHVLLRTAVFAAVNVGLTLLIGTGMALLMERVSRWMRVLFTTGLVLVWAMPVVVAVTVWQWMVDQQFGVFNWLLSSLGWHSMAHHNWFENPVEGLGVITAVVVWGALPFVVLTLYAGLTQVPKELTEAARIDGADAFAVFRHVTFPILKPLFIILTSLSVIWDFGVFTQVFLMRNARPEPDYYLMNVYAYEKAFGISEYGEGATVAVVIVLVLLAATVFYIRQMVRIGEVGSA